MNKPLIAMVVVILWGSLLNAAEFTAWLPEICKIKAIAAGEPFASDDGLVNRPRYSSVCMGTMGSYNNENDMKTALQTLATQYNRPEIKFAGVIRLGCSSDSKQPVLHAGIFRSNMVAAIPMDGVGFIDSKEYVGPTGFWIGDLHNIALTSSRSVDIDTLVLTPMLIAVAENDVLAGSEKQRRFLIEGRKRGAAWTFVSRPGMGHCSIDAKWQTFLGLWVEAIVPLRVPTSYNGTSFVNYSTIDVTKGWLGGMKIEQTAKTSKYGPNTRIASAWVAKYDSFIGSKDSASWFPNESVAKAWLSYVTGSAQESPVKVEITSPVAMSVYKPAKAGDSISVTITASASSTLATISSVTFSAEGKNSATIGTVSTSPYTITWKFKPCDQNSTGNEIYNVFATAKDSKGNSAASSFVPIVIECPGSVHTNSWTRNSINPPQIRSLQNMIIFKLGNRTLNYKVQLFETSGRLLCEKTGNSNEVQFVNNEILTDKIIIWKIIENHSMITTGSFVN